MTQPNRTHANRATQLFRSALTALLLAAATGFLAGCSTRSECTSGACLAQDGSVNGQVGMGNACKDGLVVCEGTIAKICDGRGGFRDTTDCSSTGKHCLTSRNSSVSGSLLTLGCVACTPGEASCDGGKARHCPEDGSGFVDFDCDSVQGMRCEPSGCKGACAPAEAGASYIGCDYYPTVTLNPVWQGFDFAVSVANASFGTAHVTINLGDTTVSEHDVAVGAVEIIPLPWNLSLKGEDVNACQVAKDPGATRRVDQGAYRLRSDRPVTVHQYSPLQYELKEADGSAPAECPVGAQCNAMFGTESCLSYSNDASLLLPATTLTGDYTVMSWPSAGTTASFYAITATENGTSVELNQIEPIAAGGGISSTGRSQITLDRGDVLQVVARHGGTAQDNVDADTSGSRIHADKPIQVIGGNSCALIPTRTTGECDHIEQALFPSQILGTRYVASFPRSVSDDSPHVLRLSAIEPDTEVTFDPPLFDPVTLQPGQAPVTLQVGNDSEVPADIVINSTHPIAVAQFMQGQKSVPSLTGDPSMALVVPTAQYRTSYVFVASVSYDLNFINVVSEGTPEIQLDGRPLRDSGSAVGSSQYRVRKAELDSSQSEVHTITSDKPFGLVVYGYGRYTSYMYPGGLDLKRIAHVPLE